MTKQALRGRPKTNTPTIPDDETRMLTSEHSAREAVGTDMPRELALFYVGLKRGKETVDCSDTSL